MSTIHLEEGINFDINIPAPAEVPAFFVFGLHKSGSTLLNKVMVDICHATGIPSISIPNEASSAGLLESKWRNAAALNDIIKDGYCFRGFRNYPSFLLGNNFIDQRKKILLIRDPRDAIVSAYFSFKGSHVIPSNGGELAETRHKQREKINELTLEEFVLSNASKFRFEFNLYMEQLDTNSDLLRVYRYEDIIFNKERWILDILEFLNLEVPASRVERIAEKHNIVPGQEDQSQHIRKVKPGDHIDKLSLECIHELNGIFKSILRKFNYIQ